MEGSGFSIFSKSSGSNVVVADGCCNFLTGTGSVYVRHWNLKVPAISSSRDSLPLESQNPTLPNFRVQQWKIFFPKFYPIFLLTHSLLPILFLYRKMQVKSNEGDPYNLLFPFLHEISFHPFITDKRRMEITSNLKMRAQKFHITARKYKK